MAHQFLFYPSQRQMTSMLEDFVVQVDGDYVDVELVSPCREIIFSERYYPYNSKVTLRDIGSLIESDMRTSQLSFADYTLAVYTDTRGNLEDSCTLQMMYCDRLSVCQDVDLFLQENFLTTLQMRRIAPDGAISLYFFAKPNWSIEYSLDVTYRKIGTTELLSQQLVYNEGLTPIVNKVMKIDIAPEQLLDKLDDATDCEIVSVTVTAGQRSATFFVDQSLGSRSSTLDFLFRNCFNIIDSVSLPSVTTAKTEVDRSTAIIGGKSEFYDQNATKSYEVESAGLTSDEAEFIDQLFTSHEVLRKVYSKVDDETTQEQVIITDSTCEVQDGDDAINSVKFTWRYADNRPMVQLSAANGIFAKPYNIVYT